MYKIMYEMSSQSRYDARYWMLGTTQRDGMGREEGGGLWQIHFDIWQNQYNIVKLNKIKLKKINMGKLIPRNTVVVIIISQVFVL